MSDTIIRNQNINEVIRLCAMNSVPFEVYTSTGYPNCISIAIPNVEYRELDISCNPANYSGSKDLIEIFRDDNKPFAQSNDPVVSNLTACECFNIIKNYCAVSSIL